MKKLIGNWRNVALMVLMVLTLMSAVADAGSLAMTLLTKAVALVLLMVTVSLLAKWHDEGKLQGLDEWCQE